MYLSVYQHTIYIVIQVAPTRTNLTMILTYHLT